MYFMIYDHRNGWREEGHESDDADMTCGIIHFIFENNVILKFQNLKDLLLLECFGSVDT